MASLAQACLDDQPGPLDLLPPGLLAESAAQAVQQGWLDDPGHLPPRSEALALWELASALPPGETRAAFEGRARGWLLRGDAGTFAALAARMVQAGDLRLDESQGLRARASLCLGLEASSGVRSDLLAVAMVTRPGVAHSWLEEQSLQSMPQRRAAARLLEHSARGAARKAAVSDGWLRRVLSSDAFQVAYPRLLADREPLVWHHAAVARGLLSAYHEPFEQSIAANLAPHLSPTEWRRAAVSLAASIAHSPGAPGQLAALLAGGFLRRTPGLAGELVRGLCAAAEVEPEAADHALGLLLAADPVGAAEALPGLIERGFAPRPGRVEVATAALEQAQPRGLVDDGAEALRALRLAALRGEADGTAYGSLQAATRAFVEQGPAEAHRLAREALDQIEASVATLALLDEVDSDDDPEGTEIRRRLFTVLHHLQRSALHDDAADALLALGDDAPGLDALAGARDWIATWVLRRWTARPLATGAFVPHLGLQIQQILVLLYAADSWTQASAPATVASARQRRQHIASAMLDRLQAGVPRPLERVVCAALARALDALLLSRDLSPVDVVLLVARGGLGEGPIRVLTEASAHHDIDVLLSAYLASFRDTLGLGPGSSPLVSIPPTQRAPGPALTPATTLAPGAPRPGASLPPSLSAYSFFSDRLRRLIDFAQQLDAEASSRAEACRSALLLLGRSLQRLLAAGSIADAVQGAGEGDAPLAAFDLAWQGLLQLISSAEHRVRLRGEHLLLPRATAPAIALALANKDSGEVAAVLSRAQNDLEKSLPEVFSALAAPILGSLIALPLTSRARPLPPREQPLPAWVPPHRMIGGFYLVSPVGAGGAGSVFVACRVADKNDPAAERFALKVPEYTGTAARTLSEEQFMQLFRAEASALLNLPQHPNLSRFVTFDLATRPKPILVMELVEGQSLDQLTQEKQEFSRVVALLDGVLAGLAAMHETGIGHHDIKPQNVILRGGRDPVLVDFGLAGRTLRPGCGSLSYSAPEIWLGTPGDAPVSPVGADVYAVACLAFELLTGEPLFASSSEVAAISAHIAHDGWPAPLQDRKASLGPIAALLHQALRRDPAARLSAAAFRQRLRALA